MIVSGKDPVPLADSSGVATTATVSFDGEQRYVACEPWGMPGADERLHRGGVSNARIVIGKVPFKRYDLVVHLGADVNWWNGDIVLERPDGTEIDSRGVFFGWIGNGRYVEATSPKGVKPDNPDCYVVFRGLDEAEVALTCTRTGGNGAAAIVGFQLVPR